MSTTTTIRPDPTQRRREQDPGLAGALATLQQQYGPAVVGSRDGAAGTPRARGALRPGRGGRNQVRHSAASR
jgi:hypothetical protein